MLNTTTLATTQPLEEGMTLDPRSTAFKKVAVPKALPPPNPDENKFFLILHFQVPKPSPLGHMSKIDQNTTYLLEPTNAEDPHPQRIGKNRYRTTIASKRDHERKGHKGGVWRETLAPNHLPQAAHVRTRVSYHFHYLSNAILTRF